MPRRAKPKTPQQIAAERLARRAQDFEAVSLDAASASLPAFADVQIERLSRKNATRAWRSNVFRLLLERKAITLDHFTAAEKLATDWAVWKGLAGARETLGEAVDGGNGSVELINDAMIQAGRRVSAALAYDGAHILRAFMVATVEEDRPMAWRGIMERLGFTVRDRQTEAVVRALDALRGHYQEPRWAA